MLFALPAWPAWFGCAAPAGGEGPPLVGAPATWVDEGLLPGEPRPCPEPLPAPAWSDRAEAWGLRGNGQPDGDAVDGGALGVADLDGDGDLDIVQAYDDDALRVAWWDAVAGVFVEQEVAGERFWVDVEFADIDEDGLLDLIGVNVLGPRVLLNRGAGTFERIELPSWERASLREAAPGDLDGDGHVDLYVLGTGTMNHGEELARDVVLLGDGRGGFQLDEDAVPAEVRGRQGFDADWGDIDLDGDLDVVVANDLGDRFGGNAVLVNEGGRLVHAGPASCEPVMSGMGTNIEDVTGDGLPDLYHTDALASRLMVRWPDGECSEEAAARGVDVLGVHGQDGWGSAFFDRDNDGDLDLAVARGPQLREDGEDFPPMASNYLENDGTGHWIDRSAELGLDVEGSWRSVVAVDLNDDGMEDLLVGGVDDRPLVLVSEGCTAAGWIEVTGPLGSRVTVEAGGRVQTRRITTASGYAGARPPLVHFGLGSAPVVDRLEVLLPDGRLLAAGSLAPRHRVEVVSAGP